MTESDEAPPLLLRRLVGDALRGYRVRQGRTLRDVADAARVSVPYLSEVERGRKEASSEVLAAVCEALRVELSDVLAEVGRDLAAVRAPVLRLDEARARRLGAGRGLPTVSPKAPTARRSGDVLLLAA